MSRLRKASWPQVGASFFSPPMSRCFCVPSDLTPLCPPPHLPSSGLLPLGGGGSDSLAAEMTTPEIRWDPRATSWPVRAGEGPHLLGATPPGGHTS